MPRNPAQLDQHKALLRRAKLRATPARLQILSALAASRAPLNAQEVADRLKNRDADRVTVYRTLNSFVEAGLAHRLDPGDRIFRFALVETSPNAESAERPAPHSHAHPHLVCDECGSVECLDDAEVIVNTKQSSHKKTAGFRVRQQEVLLHGTCGECAEPHAETQHAPKPAPSRARKKA